MNELLAFVGVAMVVIVTPAAGVVCGQAVWVLAASVGVAALLVRPSRRSWR
jgi:hypothetical protein